MIDPTTHRTMSERSTSELRPAPPPTMFQGRRKHIPIEIQLLTFVSERNRIEPNVSGKRIQTIRTFSPIHADSKCDIEPDVRVEGNLKKLHLGKWPTQTVEPSLLHMLPR